MGKRFFSQVRIEIVKKNIFSQMHFIPLSLLFLLTTAAQQRVAIVGSSGYLGSYLHSHLQSHGEAYSVHGYDAHATPLPESSLAVSPLASAAIPTAELQGYDVVIYLGGLSGRTACDGAANLTAVGDANVEDVSALALRMLPSQLLLFASSAALSVGSGATPASETSPLHAHLFDAYEASMLAREQRLRHLALGRASAFPTAIGLRFATAVGPSPSPRSDLLHMRMACSALTGGAIGLSHPETVRGVLGLQDAAGAIEAIMAAAPTLPRYDVFNLQSHAATVSAAANTIAATLRVRVAGAAAPASHTHDPGFSLSTRHLTEATNFTPSGTPSSVLAALLPALPAVCSGRAAPAPPGTPPCVICGSHDMQPVLDLQSQPLANDFFNTTAAALACETYPLGIARCRRCAHTQLTHFVDRERLFRDYKYVSGTTASGKAHFEWVARKVVQEAGAAPAAGGAVLDIACNDGSQLNPFRAAGWATHCVDPAANLAPIARAAGHTVHVAFWGVDAVQLPPLDAIIAQNVLAHVLNPMDFVRAAAAAMGPATRLYLQTSQCEMYATGQFDTVYHEHVSFFSAHSFARMADLAGLTIVHFEKVPIHGVSCLVTLMKSNSSSSSSSSATPSAPGSHADSLQVALQEEVSTGQTSDFFYHRYRSEALRMRGWMHSTLSGLAAAGYELAGFGAAAKGMVLLHFLLTVPGRQWNLTYVIDESPFKQSTYCPGTTIPVLPASALASRARAAAPAPPRPLALVVLAWNFAEEILGKIAKGLKGSGVSSVLAIIPFPQQRLVRLDVATGKLTPILQSPQVQPPWPAAPVAPSTVAVLTFGNVRAVCAHSRIQAPPRTLSHTCTSLTHSRSLPLPTGCCLPAPLDPPPRAHV